MAFTPYNDTIWISHSSPRSSRFARLLQRRFTDDDGWTDEFRAIGGRLDFKVLEGTHVTPNVPQLTGYLGGIDPSLAAVMGYGTQLRIAMEVLPRR